jgi:Domain of unknown function (DUF1818)
LKAFWREGDDWVLGYDPTRQPYCLLLGGSNWSFELDAFETKSFARLLNTLGTQWQASLAEIMDEETLCCVVGDAYVEIECFGSAQVFGLRLRLLSGRKAEGIWENGGSLWQVLDKLLLHLKSQVTMETIKP